MWNGVHIKQIGHLKLCSLKVKLSLEMTLGLYLEKWSILSAGLYFPWDYKENDHRISTYHGVGALCRVKSNTNLEKKWFNILNNDLWAAIKRHFPGNDNLYMDNNAHVYQFCFFIFKR